MKRLVLFVVALVFAFCTTVMAAEPMAAPAAAPATEKAAPAKVEKVKKVKKMKKAKKIKKAEEKKAEEAAPAAQNKFVKTLCGFKEGTGKTCPFFFCLLHPQNNWLKKKADEFQNFLFKYV